jgi:hypothetical protein
MNRYSLLIYDVIGAALVLTLVGVGVWCGVIDRPRAGEALAAAHVEQAKLTAETRSIESAVAEARTKVGSLDEQMKTRGALPERSPVEADLLAITNLARQGGVELFDVRPNGARRYPGVVELRYALRAEGSFTAILRFLDDFRESSFWADVTQLKLSREPGETAEAAAHCKADLVVSLFASDTGGEVAEGGS